MFVKHFGPGCEVDHSKGLSKEVRMDVKNFVEFEKIESGESFKNIFEVIEGVFVFR